MSANYQHLGLEGENSLIQAFWVKSPRFGFHWHYHTELEITCVKHGRGMRMVGDNVSSFGNGDFVFMGSMLPHTWISDDDFNQSNEMMEVAVLQFHPSVLNKDLLKLEEMKHVRNLLEHAGKGIDVPEGKKAQASQMLFDLVEAEGFERYALFMSLLNYLGSTDSFIQLASQAYIPPLNTHTEKRILAACRYIHEHFRDPLTLADIADKANMNPSSFCRFFRKSTGQPIFEYIHDLRIGKACNLLLGKNSLSISDIAFQSGFNSQTLFNRIFLKKKGMTPTPSSYSELFSEIGDRNILICMGFGIFQSSQSIS